RKAEDQRPQDLPEHPERERQRVNEIAADVRDDGHRVRVKRRTAASSSRLFFDAALESPEANASATQCSTWSSRIASARLSRAVFTAAIWVRMSMQYRSSSTIR